MSVGFLPTTLAEPNQKRNDTANAKRTRFKQKAAMLNYDRSFNIILKNIQKLRWKFQNFMQKYL